MSLIATAVFTNNYVEYDTVVTRLPVINGRTSSIAKGWSVAGVQRAHLSGTDVLVTEGDGGITWFTGCSPTCTSPIGETSRLASIAGGKYAREYPDSSKVVFNAQGRMELHLTRTLDSTVFTYDAQNRLERIYDPFRTAVGGITHLYTQLAYGPAGLLQSVTEPGVNQSQSGGRITQVGTAADSTLQSWTDPDNVITQLRYDASKRLQHFINRRGDSTSYFYDASTWKLDSVSAPNIGVDPSLFGANQKRRLTTGMRPWQTAGVPIAPTVSSPLPAVQADTIRGRVTAPGNLTTAFTVDAWGQAVVSTLKPGSTTQQVTRVYKSALSPYPDSVEYHTGARDRFRFSTSGLLEFQRLAGQDSVNITYQAFAQPLQVSGPKRPRVNYFIGTRGRIDSLRFANAYVTQFFYDARVRVIRSVDPGGHVDSLFYEPIFGQQVRVVTPGKRTTDIVYDGRGRDSVTSLPPTSPHVTFYDVLNRVLQTRNESGPNVQADSTRYTYDALFPSTIVTRVTGQGGPVNQTYQLRFNALGADSSETDPAGGSQRFFYDHRGLNTLRLNARNDSIITRYDSLHRPTIVTLKKAGSNTIVRADSFFYDLAGRVLVGSNKNSRDSLFFSAAGWTDSVVTRFATDPSKRIRVLYGQDSRMRLDSVHVLFPGSIAATSRRFFWKDSTDVLDSLRVAGQMLYRGYNNELLPVQFTQPGHVVRTQLRTTSHESYTQSYSTTAVDTLLNRGVNFDTLGRATVTSRPAGPVDRLISRYQYDVRGRLTSYADSLYDYAGPCTPIVDPDYGARPCPGAVTKFAQSLTTVAFDEVGNIINNVGAGGTGNPTYSNNRIVSWPGFTFLHDADGNITERIPTSGNTNRYYWSPDGLLDSVKTTGAAIRYDYNAFGQLVRLWPQTASPGQHLVWDQGHVLAELNGTLSSRRGEYAYLPGVDQPIAFLTGATAITARRFIYQDVQGTVIGLVRDNGTVFKAATTGDPWGVAQNWTGGALPDTMRLRWQGLFRVAPAGNLFYARARWYDPQIKRFLSPDPLGVAGGVNPYVFAANDPLNLRDPSGLEPECEKDKKKYGECLATIPVLAEQDDRNSGYGPNPSDRGGRPWGTMAFPQGPGPQKAPSSANVCEIPLAPPGADLRENLRVANTRALQLGWFKRQVQNRGPWDYKQQGRQYADFGNFNYGAAGRAALFRPQLLLRMAGYAQRQAGTSLQEWGSPTGGPPYGDDPADQALIQRGINFYQAYLEKVCK